MEFRQQYYFIYILMCRTIVQRTVDNLRFPPTDKTLLVLLRGTESLRTSLGQ